MIGHRAGYFSNLAWSNLTCDWQSIAQAYYEQETENGPRDALYSDFIFVFECCSLNYIFVWNWSNRIYICSALWILILLYYQDISNHSAEYTSICVQRFIGKTQRVELYSVVVYSTYSLFCPIMVECHKTPIVHVYLSHRTSIVQR